MSKHKTFKNLKDYTNYGTFSIILLRQKILISLNPKKYSKRPKGKISISSFYESKKVKDSVLESANLKFSEGVLGFNDTNSCYISKSINITFTVISYFPDFTFIGLPQEVPLLPASKYAFIPKNNYSVHRFTPFLNIQVSKSILKNTVLILYSSFKYRKIIYSPIKTNSIKSTLCSAQKYCFHILLNRDMYDAFDIKYKKLRLICQNLQIRYLE